MTTGRASPGGAFTTLLADHTPCPLVTGSDASPSAMCALVLSAIHIMSVLVSPTRAGWDEVNAACEAGDYEAVFREI